MASDPNTALSAISFVNSMGINVHMNYTDGAYANEANVASDLAYLGITYIRDGLPTNTASIPTQNQITALNQLAAQGIKFDLGMTSTNVQVDINAANAMEISSPGAIIALEGPNEINNWPITYNGLTGQAGATAFQRAFYYNVKGDAALKGVSVYDFTGGTSPVLTPYGTMTENSNGSFTLVKGITGWLAYLPVGITTISATYTGTVPYAGLYNNGPGAGQQGGLTPGANGALSFTYNNTGTTAMRTWISFSDWNSSTTITSLSAVSGNSGNLVVFDPNMSLSGEADDSNTHPYASGGAAPGSAINSTAGLPVPGPHVITEDGYNTDPNDPNGVSQTVQAQDEVKIFLDAYKAGDSKTYLYELLDEKPDPSNTDSEMHFGVFNNNNTPKLAAVAIHDLTSLLNANDALVSGFKPGSLAWSATGLPATASTMLLEKTNGAFDLAVWNEPAAASASATNVTLALGATYGTVEVFDPITGSAPITTLTNVSQVTLSLGLDPLIVEVEPAGFVNAAAPKPGLPAKLNTLQLQRLSSPGVASMTQSQISALSQARAATLPEADTAAIRPAGLLAARQMGFLAASGSAARPEAAVSSARTAAHLFGQAASLRVQDFASLPASDGKMLSAGHTDGLTVATTSVPFGAAMGHHISAAAQLLPNSHVKVVSTAHADAHST